MNASGPESRRRIGVGAFCLVLSILSGCADVGRLIRRPMVGWSASTKPTAVTARNLNLRKGPGMGHRILTTIPKGTRVEVRGEQGSWRKIGFSRQGTAREGWASAKYLKEASGAKESRREETARAEKAEKERIALEKEQIALARKAEKKREARERQAERERLALERKTAKERAALDRQAEKQRLALERQAEENRAARDREERRELAALEAERKRAAAERKRPSAVRVYGKELDHPDPEAPAPVGAAEPEEPKIAALPVARPTPSLESPASVIESTGYAAEHRSLRDSLARGKFKDVELYFAQLDSKARKDAPDAATYARRVGLLRLLERGALDVDRGRVDQAAESFANAETLLATRAPESEDVSPSGGFPGLRGIFSRREEKKTTDDAGEGFERVWTLDYHALALLLRGDPEAIEVAGRAISAQEEEKQRLEESMRALEQEISGERERAGEDVAQAVENSLASEYARSATLAEKAPSAFANPFAHYVAAIADELGARKDPKLRERARAHYAKALEMNPESDLFREAVDDLSADGEASDDRIVHVLVAEGFAPEKGVLRYELPTGRESIDVRLPIYSPVTSPFVAAALTVDPSEPPLTLSEIVDVEAASFRYEQDTAPKRELGMLRAARTGEDMPEPDTSSWMTLPARFHAARLRLPKQALKLALATFDAKSARIGGTTVVLDAEADAFIYVRSAGPILAIRATSPDWFRESTVTASADGDEPASAER